VLRHSAIKLPISDKNMSPRIVYWNEELVTTAAKQMADTTASHPTAV